MDLFSLDDGLLRHPDGLTLIVDKGYRDQTTEQWLAERGVTVVRPAYRTEPPRPSAAARGPPEDRVGQPDLQGQLDLERHGGRTDQGVWVRVLQRILALTATIWHNHQTGQPVLRSLIADDH